MLEKDNHVDIRKLKTTIEALIKKHSAKAKTEEFTNDTKAYRIDTKEAALEIILGPKWIGYDLSIDKSALGTRKNIGTSEDTDNYPLDFDIRSTQAIFENVKACLEGLLVGRIFIGFMQGKPTLAVPISRGRFKVLKKGKLVTDVIELGFEDLNQISPLRPVK